MTAMAIISKETQIRIIKTIRPASLTTTTMAGMKAAMVTTNKGQMDIMMSRKFHSSIALIPSLTI
jgi:hypothetical protein